MLLFIASSHPKGMGLQLVASLAVDLEQLNIEHEGGAAWNFTARTRIAISEVAGDGQAPALACSCKRGEGQIDRKIERRTGGRRAYALVCSEEMALQGT